ncbi:MAG: NAD(P)/FAD-dependent oxidoreductase [Woeseiaceae bacterium]|nr:NAD(P)/FAD-dependent oxidoreductase [Woeseiaceae bacterium]
MQLADAIVVGGGPAGSTCAWKLEQAGLDVLVLDREAFPRTKLCAGWVTPEAIADLELDPADYPLSFMTFEVLTLHWKALSKALSSRQHSIRRYEFDDFLLQRSGARVVRHKVRDIVRDGPDFVIDGEYRAKYLVGAAGTRCPVYRCLFHDRNPRSSVLQTATYEQEFAYDWQDPRCHLWFFDDGLPGYAWYVPKANGHINVGIGGMAKKLKAQGRNIREYWAKFVARLNERGLLNYTDFAPGGYSYYLRGDVDVVRDGNAFIAGDAVGLATRDMCEGIGPAVKSGILAAQAIVGGAEYSLDELERLTGRGLASRMLEKKFAGSH